MHKVEAGILLNAVPERVVDGLLDLIPAHVRDLQAGAVGFMQLIAKEAHLAREQTEAVNTAILFAVLQQHLHADADAEQGLFPGGLTDHAVEFELAQFADAVANGTNARQQHAVGGEDDLRITGHVDLAGACMFKRLGNRVQVAHAVINNCNSIHGEYACLKKGWLQRALSGRQGVAHTRIHFNRHTYSSAEGFKNSLCNMVRILATNIINVQRNLSVINKTLKKF